MRQLLAVLFAVFASALGALILGEYELKGSTPFVAGVLFGLVVAELTLAVAKPRPLPWVQAATAVLPGAGMVWAAYISSGKDWHYVPGVAWVGVALAPLAAAAWLGNARGRGSGAEHEQQGA
jgi:hypothetical protein